MDLVVLNDTRMYNQHGPKFGVTVEIDLVLKFFDPTFKAAQEAFQRCFTVITTRINMDEYRTERSLGLSTPTPALLNDIAHKPALSQLQLNQRNGGQHVFYHLPLPELLLRSHPAVIDPHPEPLQPIITPLATMTNGSQWQAVDAALTNKVTMIRGAAATGKSLTLAVIMEQLLRRRDGRSHLESKVMYLAPTNQAVDVAMIATRRLFQAHILKFNLVRWYSNHQVELNYLSNAWREWPADHIELLRWMRQVVVVTTRTMLMTLIS